MFRKLGWTLGAAGALTLSACDSSTAPGGGNVSLSFSALPPAGAAALIARAPSAAFSTMAAGDSLVIVSGTDTLVITSVEVVLRKIELNRVETTAACDSLADDDDCEEFTLGAMLVSLPLSAGTDLALDVPLDTGTYDEVQFKIHKPENDSVDQAFKAANPTWPTTASIRVIGRFNGTPFTYTSGLSEEQELELIPPLVVSDVSGPVNLTIRMDVTTWFLNGSALINPATANPGQPNQSAVEENIKNSIEAFEDDDRDGDESDG